MAAAAAAEVEPYHPDLLTIKIVKGRKGLKMGDRGGLASATIEHQGSSVTTR